MTLVVETGAIVAGAESFASVAQFKTYSTNFGFSYTTLSDAQIEVALRQATRYLTQEFRMRWKGIRVNAAQALDWPRSGVNTEPTSIGSRWAAYYLVPNDIVPTEVVNACIIMAQKASAGTDLFPDGTQKTIQETVGPITTKYADGSPQRVQYDAVESLLAVLLTSVGGVSVGLVRG